MIYGWISPWQHPIFALFLAIAVSACGGGGGGGSDNGAGFVPAPEPQGATIDVTITDTQGQSITEISPVQQGVFLVSVTNPCLLYTSPSPRDRTRSRMPSSA